MNFVRYVILGLLLISVGLSLSVNIPNQLQTVAKGQVADFPVTVQNTQNSSVTVLVSAASSAPVSVSDRAFTLGSYQSKDIHVFAVTSSLGEGVYLIALKINDGTYNLAVNVQKNSPILRFDPVYDTIDVVQGEYQDLKFLVRNEGSERLRNIVIRGDIATSLKAQYPVPFDLAPNQVKQVSVRVTVPADYNPDEYELALTAGAGNLVEKATVLLRVTQAENLKNKVSLEVLSPWEAVKENNTGNTIGYKIPFRITNNAISDVSRITWKLVGLPDGWEIMNNDSFSLKGFETKDVSVTFIPKDFSEHSVNVTIMKGLDLLATQNVTFNGFKVGAATGFVILGGDAFLGLVVVIVIAIGVIYVRRRNAKQEVAEETETRSYLEKLVEESKTEAPKEAPKAVTRPRASKRKK